MTDQPSDRDGFADRTMPLIALTKTSSEFGEISVVQNKVARSHLYWQEGFAQSEADRHGVSLAAYVHAIFGLVAQTSAHATLMIGCGGGTLGTMLTRSGRSVTVVDINPQSIALARQYFSLPEHVTCYVEDGASFLERSQSVFDVIIIDAFIEEKIPRHLCSVDFFRLVRQRLAAAGCVFMNVFLQHGGDRSSDVIADRMAHAGFQVRVLASPGAVERNAIVMGGAVAILHKPNFLMKPEVLEDEIAADLQVMQFQDSRRSWNLRTAAETRCSQIQ
jgi:spermidine synthase